jgi:hypothetical protein
MSNNLNLDQVSPSQSSKEATINAATGELDAALTELLVIDMTNNVTISAANYQRHLKFNLTPSGTGKTLTLLAQKKFSIISNNSANSINITIGTTTIALAAGSNGFFYSDGTANGLVQQGGGSGGGGSPPGGTTGQIQFNNAGVFGGFTMSGDATLNTSTGVIIIPTFIASGASHAKGEVPDPGATAGTTRYLREDATWVVPAGGGGSTVTLSDTPPGSPASGALWYDTAGGQMYIYYNDGTSSQWVPASNQKLAGAYLPTTGGQLTGDLTVPSLNGGQLAGMRNLIINGDFRIDQRYGGTNQSPVVGGTSYLGDRWLFNGSQPAKFQGQQGTGTALGFPYNLGASVIAAYTPLTGDYFCISQAIEGLNVGHLMWGTASAKPVTLSFWAYSSIAGTHSGAVVNKAGTRGYPFTFTIPIANTWTFISGITIPGDVTGTWVTDNTASILLRFNLGAGSTFLGAANAWGTVNAMGATGSVQVVATASANLALTGVQLEMGSVATPFERRLIGTELALCQRYYQRYVGAAYSMQLGGYNATGSNFLTTMLIPPMRVSPTSSIIGTWSLTNCSSPGIGTQPGNCMSVVFYTTVTTTGSFLLLNNASSGFDLLAEL